MLIHRRGSLTEESAILIELFVVLSAPKYSGIAGPSPAGLSVNSIVTVAAVVAQLAPQCSRGRPVGPSGFELTEQGGGRSMITSKARANFCLVAVVMTIAA